MASINGILIRNLKCFPNNEGGESYKGDVWYKGKKLGSWAQNYDSDIRDTFNFDVSLLDEEVKNYKFSDRVSDEYENVYYLEWLLNDLADLQLHENTFKSIKEKGYDSYAEIGYEYDSVTFGFSKKKYPTKEKLLRSDLYKKHYKKFEKSVLDDYYYVSYWVRVFMSKRDFNLEL